MRRRRRTHRIEVGIREGTAYEEPGPQIQRRWPKRLRNILVVLVCVAVAGWFLYNRQKPRVIRVRVYTDFAFRQNHADNWEQLVRERFAGVNRIYESAVGVRWEIESLDRADPTAVLSDVDLRRRS